MAFRAPRFSYENAYRDRGVANISLDSGTAHADFPLDNLMDDRIAFAFRMASADILRIDLDLGASFETGYDGILIGGQTYTPVISATVIEASDAAFTADWKLLGSTAQKSDGTAVSKLLNFPSSQRYIRFSSLFSSTYQITELVLTKIVTFTKDPDLRGSRDDHEHSFHRFAQPSGRSPTVQYGARRRRIDYQYDDLTGADLVAMDAFIDAVGMSTPFWVDPASFSTPPETDEPPLWMKFASPPVVTSGRMVPADGTEAKSFHLKLIESLD